MNNLEIYDKIKEMKSPEHKEIVKNLLLIESLLLDLGIKQEELKEYCTEPKETLFGKSIVELVALNQEGSYVEMLKSRLGRD